VKRFHFPLEKVRGWRRTRFESETTVLERLLAERLATVERRRRVEREADEALRQVLGSAVLSPEQLAAADSYRSWAARESAKLLLSLRALEERIESQRRAVRSAKREADVLDHMREEALARWRQEADRETEAMVADLVVARWQQRKLE
jgi:flagellar biosynthesis chaperone FliJ